MSHIPQLIVVTGVPVNDRLNEAYKWTMLLFLSHLIYLVFKFLSDPSTADHTSPILDNCFRFLICGVYVPLALYKNVQKQNWRMLRLFVILLTIISIVGFTNAISTICAYFELRYVCVDCADDFQMYNGTCVIAFGNSDAANLIVTEQECQTMSELVDIVPRHTIELFIAMVGFITACKVTSSGQTGKRYGEVLTPDDIAIVNIEGQPVAVRAETVPEIANL